ncbi:aspartyl-phosphate phosphatase Spo0E family protein [Clostridium formicaceticum]|uniref:Uncharacterized protein n=1 Tax=Clostridium formicaceticum TaxID=1497 RepID=A0AAC9RMI6_9CLOT|nr:aspartyl-phosphate phosphatase Spo0E family protein [Clostridium formicaceticum]AOY78144.1 hypothetical protein BJL90_21130 [Clostridium formicaceticum]ARE88796.1 hypothetical protein CLFO_32020 [Clostridium formicaceticum]
MDKISALKESLNDLLKANDFIKDEVIKLSKELDQHIVKEQKRRLRQLSLRTGSSSKKAK